MMKTKILLLAGMAAVGMVGCSRTESAGPQPMLNPAGTALSATSPSYDERAYSADIPSYATRSRVRTISAEPPPMVETYEERGPVYNDRRTVYTERGSTSRRTVRRDRPFSHSAAIVGGSAGAGAIVGALAGGGKGAGIGALVGGGGGLVYDRLTHKRR